MPEAPAQTIVAVSFDFGLKRIGIAAGDSLTQAARPIATIAARDGTPDWSIVDRYVRDWDPAILVVGVPYNMDGTATTLTEAARVFATTVGGRYQKPVVQVDERLSSREAEDQLRQRRSSGERSRRVSRGDVDAVAATVLLEQWLRESRPLPRT
jgi:putative holliday junction resolvase